MKRYPSFARLLAVAAFCYFIQNTQAQQKCTANQQCATGNCYNYYCQPLAGNGAQCISNQVCASKNCVDYRCQPSGGNGSQCISNQVCASKNCVDYRCQPLVGNGAQCISNQVCASKNCVDYRCQPLVGNGAQCISNQVCASKNCVDYRCQATSGAQSTASPGGPAIASPGGSAIASPGGHTEASPDIPCRPTEALPCSWNSTYSTLRPKNHPAVSTPPSSWQEFPVFIFDYSYTPPVCYSPAGCSILACQGRLSLEYDLTWIREESGGDTGCPRQKVVLSNQGSPDHNTVLMDFYAHQNRFPWSHSKDDANVPIFIRFPWGGPRDAGDVQVETGLSAKGPWTTRTTNIWLHRIE
jgi:hypothetical protein